MKIKRLAIAMFVIFGVAAATVLTSSYASSSGLVPWRSASDGRGEVLMRLGDHAVTLLDIDQRWKRDQPVPYMAAMQTLYDGRKAALEAVVSEVLITAEAEKRGLSIDSYLELELTARADAIDERDVQAFYMANAGELGGTVDLYRDRIKSALAEQARQRARRALVGELASAAGYDLDLVLDVPRQAISVSSTDPALGHPSAPVTIVAFSDFQCPFCARVEPSLKEIHKLYGDKVRIVWKDFPLTPIHPEAFKAAEAAHCAAEQGRYWEFHDRLFAHQERLGVEVLKAHASALGMDGGTFARCLDSSRYEPRVREGMEAGQKLGIEATPTMFVNGRIVSGAQPVDVFAKVINEELDRAGPRR